MDGHRYRLSSRATEDLESILRESERTFGPHQRRKYTDLIHQAAALIAADPLRLGSKSREDILPGVRSLHLERAAGRRGAASHVLFYVPRNFDDGTPGVFILRILHQHMEPARHLPGDPTD